MNKLSLYFLSIFFVLSAILAVKTLYMYTTAKQCEVEKNSFVKLVGLPDLSLSNSAGFIRHRSYSDTFSLFSNDPNLLEHFPSTFTYSYSPIQYKNPSRIELD